MKRLLPALIAIMSAMSCGHDRTILVADHRLDYEVEIGDCTTDDVPMLEVQYLHL